MLRLSRSRTRTRPVRPRSIRSCTHCRYGRAVEPSVATSVLPGPGASALIACIEASENVSVGDGAAGVANTCTSRPSSATAMPPSGRQHSAVIGRSNRLISAVAAPSRRQQRGAVGDVERLAVGGEVLGRVELGDDLGLFQDLVRLQRAVERRHGDGRIAPPEQAVGEALQRRDHWLFPQRLSYCTKPDRRHRACNGRSGCWRCRRDRDSRGARASR